MIILRDIVKTFGAVRALDDLDLEVRDGQIHGFIGPNGAGKTTAIRIMLGLIKANSGQASIFGQDAFKEAVRIHRRIAYVPGEVSLWPNLTGGEVIDLMLSLNGVKQDDLKDELIEVFDFDPGKKCRTYSKGNRQKVALIAAFASDPELYILDEPTSGLDPLMVAAFQDRVLQEKAAGKTVLLSSHILSEVEQLCDYISIIRQGKIIDAGTLAELRHLTYTDITVETKEPLGASLEQYPQILNFESDGNNVHFSVPGDILGDVIAIISKKGIIKLESMPPTLEKLFIGHYGKDSADGHGS